MQEYVTVKILLNSQEILMVNPTVIIKKSVGIHTNVKVQGIVKAESYEQLMGVSSMTDLQIQVKDTPENLFFGVVTYLDIQINISEGKQYQELFMEAMSYTCLLDREKKFISFQKPGASYQEILGFILKAYPGSNYILSPEVSGKTINRFVVQYQETDWEFIKRISSFLHVPLVASHITKGAKFTLGVIWKNRKYEIQPDDEWQVDIIHDSHIKQDKGSNPIQKSHQYLRWSAEDPEAPCFEIGDGILYQGIQCYVKESEVQIRDHTLKQSCLLCSKNGFYVAETQNSYLTGLSLPGSVKEVKNNQIKVKLDLDAWEGQDCWFIYSTFYSTFYCMPEREDRVNLYFPDHVEDHAFVLNSVRTSPQTAAAGRSSSVSTGSSGQERQENGTIAALQVQPETQEPELVDITSLLDMLASPENGKLINVSAVYKGDTALAGSQGQQAGSGSNNGSGGKPESASGANGAVQQNYDFQSLAANEKIKVLCTKDGKMVILDDATGSVSIVCNNGTYIGLAGGNITITSNQKITFQAGNEIHLNAGKTLVLSAEESIQINCKESGIEITPEKVGLQGTDIKINE